MKYRVLFTDKYQEYKMAFDKLHVQYEENKNTYINFCHYLEGELKELLEKMGVPYFELHWRVKEWDSILEKIERKCLAPQSIFDIYDVIGFRITTLFKSDIANICDMIHTNFPILWEDNKADNKPEDTFGYLSVHFQIKLPEQWLQTPNTKAFRDVEAELQIRTFSQHVWAASSHLLQYKVENTIPYSLRRNINRLAAVLEIVDDELENILNAKESLRKSLLVDTAKAESETKLDSIVLEHILDEYFLEKNKNEHEPFDILLQELMFCGVNTVGMLRRLLEDKDGEIQRLEKERYKEHGKAFYTYTGKLRIAMRAAFPNEYKKLHRR